MGLKTEQPPEEERKKGFWRTTQAILDLLEFIWFCLRMVGKGIRFLFSHL